jgi:hypothetical protein
VELDKTETDAAQETSGPNLLVGAFGTLSRIATFGERPFVGVAHQPPQYIRTARAR